MKIMMQRAILFGLLCSCAFSALARHGEIDSAGETDASDSTTETIVATFERPVDDINDARIRAAIRGINPNAQQAWKATIKRNRGQSRMALT
jgi:hypothetical protein